MRRAGAGFDGVRGIQLQGPKRKIIPMRAEVAHSPTAEVPPAVPFGPREVDFVKRTLRRRSKEEIPVQKWRGGLCFLRPSGHIHDVAVPFRCLLALQPPCPADPNVALRDGTDGPTLDEFHHTTVVGRGMDLSPHLCGHTSLFCGGTDLPAFPDIVSERFLAIDVLLQLQGWQGSKGVGMLRCADGHGIKGFEFIIEFPEIGECFCFGILSGCCREVMLVHITEGHDILSRSGDLTQIARPPAATPDDHNSQFVAGSRPDQARGGRGGEDGGKEVPAAGRLGMHGCDFYQMEELPRKTFLSWFSFC